MDVEIIHNPGAFDDPEPGSTWFISIAGAIIFTALVLALSVLYYGVQTEITDSAAVTGPPVQITELRQQQWATLAEYGRYTFTNDRNEEVQRVRIPVSRAIELVAEEGFPTVPETAP